MAGEILAKKICEVPRPMTLNGISKYGSETSSSKSGGHPRDISRETRNVWEDSGVDIHWSAIHHYHHYN